ncbi:MAG: MurR/RpiR family transcriptional regulator [Anaerolineae bacterium]|nr:MurR/RpiR family transcriptional regulator [Anaerolineae bacterium]
MVKESSSNQEVLALIREAYESLSPSQRRTAEFLLAHGLDVISMTTSQIAEQVGVNRSTVVRTAQALGYEGFAELKTALQDHFLRAVNSVDRFQLGSQQLIDEVSRAEQDKQSVLFSIVHSEMRNLEQILVNIRPEEFGAAVDLMNSARRLYLIGLGSSYPLVLNINIVLRHILDCVVLRQEVDEMASQIAHIGRGDVLFAISYSRYARPTLSCIQYAREQGAQIIVLTDSHVSPAARNADLVFSLPVRLWLYGNSAAVYTFLNALTGALFLRHAKAAQSRLERVDMIYRDFGFFKAGFD